MLRFLIGKREVDTPRLAAGVVHLGICEYDGYYASSGLVVDAGTDTVYVSTADKGIVPVDGRTGTVRERIEAGGLMALDRANGLVYAVKPGNSSVVTVIDPRQEAVVARIPLDENAEVSGIAVNGATGRIYVGGKNTIQVVNIETKTVEKTIPVGAINIAADQIRNRVYVSGLYE